jgi:hypothetical protein
MLSIYTIPPNIKQWTYLLFCSWIDWMVSVMVFNGTFNNSSVISWRSVLLVEETTDLQQVTEKLYHIMLYTSTWGGVEPTTSVVICTDYIGSRKSNYLTITATTTPFLNWGIKSNWFKILDLRWVFCPT